MIMLEWYAMKKWQITFIDFKLNKKVGTIVFKIVSCQNFDRTSFYITNVSDVFSNACNSTKKDIILNSYEL